MPSDFFVNQAEYNLVYQGNPVIKEKFSALDLTLYQSYGSDNMTLEIDEFSYLAYTSIYDAPSAPQWVTAITDRFLEVKWSYEQVGTYGSGQLHLDFRDTKKNELFGWIWFSSPEYLDVIYNGESIVHSSDSKRIYRADITDNIGLVNNASLFIKGQYLSANIILSAKDNVSILESWDNEELDYIINYEIDFDAMKPDAWNLIAQLLTFQNPDFGLPEELEVVTYGFSLAIWIVVAIIAYSIITRLIPTTQGGIEN